MDAVLALHTSHSAPPPFAIYSDLTPSTRRSVTAMPVDYVVDASGLRGTTLDSTIPHTVSIEVGRQGSEEAVAFGYEACLAFLRAHGAIDDEPPTFTEKTVVAGDEEVPKGGGEPTVHFAQTSRRFPQARCSPRTTCTSTASRRRVWSRFSRAKRGTRKYSGSTAG